MKTPQEALEGAGLTPIEARIYLELLGLGSTTAGPIVKSLGLHRATAYSVLQRLIERGLVSYITRAGKRYFSAADPENILDMMKERERLVADVLPQLRKRQEVSKDRQTAHIYEGFKGIKSVYEGFLRKMSRGDEYLVINTSETMPPLEDYIINWTRRRSKLGAALKIIFSEASARSKRVEKIPLSHVKYVSKSYATPAAINIFKDITSIFLWTKRNPLALVIENNDIAESFRKYFNILWDQEARIYRGFKEVSSLFYSNMEGMKPGEEYQVLGANYGLERPKGIEGFFVGYHRDRIKRGVRVKMLCHSDVKEDIVNEFVEGGDRAHRISSIKSMPQALDSPVQINLYRKNWRSIIILWQKEPLAIVIDNKGIYQTFRNYFDSLWEQKVQVFQGNRGFQRAFNDIIETLNDGGDLSVMGVFDFNREFEGMITRFHRKRAKAGIPTRILLNEKARKIGRVLGELPGTEVKCMQEGIFTPAVFLLYKDKTLISLPNQKTFMRIENEEATRAFRAYFDILWNQKIRSYEGQEAVEKAYSSILETLRPTDEIVIFAAMPSTRRGADFNLQIARKLLKTTRRFRLIYYGLNERNKIRAGEFERLGCETKIIPTKQTLPISTVVAGDVTLNFIWEKNPLAFRIENRTIADSLRSNFELLWGEDTKTYRGVENIREAFKDMLSSFTKDETWYAFVVGRNRDDIESFFHDLHKEWAKSGRKSSLIFSEDARDICRKRSAIPLASCRTVPSEFASPAVINVCGDAVLINFWGTEREPIAYRISDSKIAGLYRKQFESLWRTAKK